MLYNFTAKNQAGELTEGRREAENKLSLSRDLRGEGISLIVAHETKGGLTLSLESINNIFVRIKLHEKIVFARNLAAMLEAGIALSRGLSILERQTENYKLKKVIVVLLEEINKGSSLSQGMGKFPKVFSSLFVSMVKAGEESGALPEALRVVGVQLEKSYLIGKKIRGAMIYPSVVLVAIFVIGALMLIYVVPTIEATFKELGSELPTSTKLILALSRFLIENTIMFFVSIGLGIAGVIFLARTKIGGKAIDFGFIHAPIFGTIVKEVNAARTARTLASLLSAGVDIQRALSITGDVLQNGYFKEILLQASTEVVKGLPISSAFKEGKNLYPIMVGEMMEVGEETGKLSTMLTNIAVFYEDEVETKTKDLSTLLEPILMLVIGSAVGFFAVSMIAPTYSVLNDV